MCMLSVPTALRVSGPTNSLGVDVHPSLLSPSQVSIGPQGQGFRTTVSGDSPGRPSILNCCLHYLFFHFDFVFCLTLSIICYELRSSKEAPPQLASQLSGPRPTDSCPCASDSANSLLSRLVPVLN